MPQSRKITPRRLLFLPHVAIVVLLIVGIFGFLYWNFGQYSDKDIADYQDIINKALKSTNKDYVVSSQHFRQNLQKDLYIQKKSGGLQFRLKSNEAHLSLERHQSKTNLVETLQDVEGWLQEELLYKLKGGKEVSSKHPFWNALSPSLIAFGAIPQQRMLYLKAKKAQYDYGNDMFVADNATILRYVMPEHNFSEAIDSNKILIQGVADRVHIRLESDQTSFQAEGFQAVIALPGASS